MVVAELPKTNSRNHVAAQSFSWNLDLYSKRRCRYLQCQSSQSFQSGCNVFQDGEAACAPAPGCPVLRQDTHAYQQVHSRNLNVRSLGDFWGCSSILQAKLEEIHLVDFVVWLALYLPLAGQVTSSRPLNTALKTSTMASILMSPLFLMMGNR